MEMWAYFENIDNTHYTSTVPMKSASVEITGGGGGRDSASPGLYAPVDIDNREGVLLSWPSF